MATTKLVRHGETILLSDLELEDIKWALTEATYGLIGPHVKKRLNNITERLENFEKTSNFQKDL